MSKKKELTQLCDAIKGQGAKSESADEAFEEHLGHLLEALTGMYGGIAFMGVLDIDANKNLGGGTIPFFKIIMIGYDFLVHIMLIYFISKILVKTKTRNSCLIRSLPIWRICKNKW